MCIGELVGGALFGLLESQRPLGVALLSQLLGAGRLRSKSQNLSAQLIAALAVCLLCIVKPIVHLFELLLEVLSEQLRSGETRLRRRELGFEP